MLYNSLFLLPLLLFGCSITNAVDQTSSNAEADKDARLFHACVAEEDSVDAVAAALAEGANINFRDAMSGQTCVMAATLRGKPNLVRYLLAQGADPTIPEKDGYSPPHGAGFQGRAEIMKILKEEAKMDVINAPHEDGYAPLHRACWGRQKRHTETVEYLLEIGEDANRKAANGVTCYAMSPNEGTKNVLIEKYGVVENDYAEL